MKNKQPNYFSWWVYFNVDQTIMDWSGSQPSDGTWSIYLTKVRNSNAFRGQKVVKIKKTGRI